MRNYAPASVYAPFSASRCSSSTKSPPGKSFTIDALLAKTEDPSCLSAPARSAEKYYPAAPFVPLPGPTGLAVTAGPYVYSPTMLSSAPHLQSGYSLHCCPPFSYQPSCRGAFYAQGKTTFLTHFNQNVCFFPVG